ncbi:MAG: hypothetical protein JW896_03635 [Deltaproteobacteria bacterium]|nr:hypothetical protein [Deltaproteobacteria bacterium]
MGQITLRGLDPEVEKEVRKISKITKKSINRVIQEIIYKHSGINQKRGTASNSLKKLAGGWSEEDASRFFETIKSCEQIDEDMWK